MDDNIEETSTEQQLTEFCTQYRAALGTTRARIEQEIAMTREVTALTRQMIELQGELVEKEALRMHFVDVRDLVRGLLLGMEKDEAVGEVFNLPGPRMLAADEVVPYLSKRLNIPYVEADLPLHRPYRELSWAKAHRILGYTPQHDLDSMVDLALAMQTGETVEVVPTGTPYGVAS